MGYDPNNVVVGVASAFIQPWSAAVPAVLPPETILYQGDWTNGGLLPWADLGATNQGWTLSIQTKSNDIRIEEQSTPVDMVADTKMISVSGELSEDTLQHMLWAYGGGTITTVAPGPAQIGKQTLTLKDSLDKWALGVETINEYGFFRRILLPKCVVTSSPQTKHRRAAEQRLYSFTAQTIAPVSQVQIVNMTATHT